MRISWSPACKQPTMWAFAGNASTVPPFPCPASLSGDSQDTAGAGVSVDPGNLAVLDELEAVGAGAFIVFEAEVVAAAHHRHDALLDLTWRHLAPSLHLLARTLL